MRVAMELGVARSTRASTTTSPRTSYRAPATSTPRWRALRTCCAKPSRSTAAAATRWKAARWRPATTARSASSRSGTPPRPRTSPRPHRALLRDARGDDPRRSRRRTSAAASGQRRVLPRGDRSSRGWPSCSTGRSSSSRTATSTSCPARRNTCRSTRVEVAFDDEGTAARPQGRLPPRHRRVRAVADRARSSRARTVPGPYKIPNIHIEFYAIFTNMVPTSAVRGAGRPQGVFAMERMMDRIAEHLGIDPAEVRARNLIQADEFPYPVGLTFRDGSPLTYDSGNYPGAAPRRARRYRLRRSQREQQAERRAEGALRGIGVSVCVEGVGLGPVRGRDGPARADGRIIVAHAARRRRDRATRPPTRRSCADALGVDAGPRRRHHRRHRPDPLRRRHLRQPGHGHRRVRRCSTRRARCAEKLSGSAGGACSRSAPRTWRSRRRRRSACAAPGGGDAAGAGRPDVQRRQARDHDAARACGRAWSHLLLHARRSAGYASSAHAVVVEVDPETGEVEILEYVVGHDCGNVINPLLVEGQVLGGFATAWATRCTRSRSTTTTAAADHELPGLPHARRRARSRRSRCSTWRPRARSTRWASKGAGEAGTIPVPAAIATAVEDALRPLGVRINACPLSPGRIGDLIAQAQEEPAR